MSRTHVHSTGVRGAVSTAPTTLAARVASPELAHGQYVGHRTRHSGQHAPSVRWTALDSHTALDGSTYASDYAPRWKRNVKRQRNGHTYITHTGVVYTVDGKYLASDGTSGKLATPIRFLSPEQRLAELRRFDARQRRIGARLERHMQRLVAAWRKRQARIRVAGLLAHKAAVAASRAAVNAWRIAASTIPTIHKVAGRLLVSVRRE